MTGRGVSWPLRLLSLCAASALAAQSLEERAAQSQAICTADFTWADNSHDLSPCSVASEVWGSCFSSVWNVPPLPQGQSYAKPDTDTTNLCTCSWAAYNLLGACTACQGFEPALPTWAAYEQNCGGYLTETYFPSNVTLPVGTAIPFWAAKNPQDWNDGRFNSAQAKSIALENHPDLIQSQSTGSNKSKTSIGPIVGGVVGGLAVLAIGAGIAFWFIRKRNRDRAQAARDHGTRPYFSRPQIHGRSMSDISGKSILLQQSMSAAPSHRPGTVYTTGTMHTHTGSVHSLSYGSGYASPPRVMSPPPAIQLISREDVIEPFTLRPTSPPASMTRKGSETTMRTTYNNQEVPGSPPPVMMHDHSSPESSQRVRLNPPAYSPYPSPASSPEPTDPAPQSSTPRDPALGHRMRGEKASVGSQQSYDSVTSRGGGGSIDDVMGRMGLTMAPETTVGSTVGGHTVSTGQSANIVSRPTHKPSVSNPDNDTLG
ncbi:hypothetical protein DFH09DRAFT_274725 [Mycena vulgaris]|nr:hypothetical protein DFH09DRAFT_274725 [Mycena vulgaris]